MAPRAARTPAGGTRLRPERHLDQTLSEAVNRLTRNYADDVRNYDGIHEHILMMADRLSQGIVKQFPRRFR